MSMENTRSKSVEKYIARLSNIKIYSDITIAVDVLMALYTVGSVAYIFFVFPSFNIRHTLFDPSMALPGTLVSGRYGFAYFALALPILRILVPMILHAVYTCPKKLAAFIISLIFNIFLASAEMILFFYLLSLRISCNADVANGRYNICNDPLYCCAHYASLTTGCTTFAPCTPNVDVSDLKPDFIFVMAMWAQVGFFVLSSLAVILTAYAMMVKAYVTFEDLTKAGYAPTLSLLGRQYDLHERKAMKILSNGELVSESSIGSHAGIYDQKAKNEIAKLMKNDMMARSSMGTGTISGLWNRLHDTVINTGSSRKIL